MQNKIILLKIFFFFKTNTCSSARLISCEFILWDRLYFMGNVFIISEYLKDIIRNCGQVTFNKDDIIIKQGDQGDWYEMFSIWITPPTRCVPLLKKGTNFYYQLLNIANTEAIYIQFINWNFKIIWRIITKIFSVFYF